MSAELYFDGLNIVLSPSVHKSGHLYTWESTGEIPEVSWQQLKQWFGFEDPEAAKRGRPKKEAAWWAAFNGDLHTLDVVALFLEAMRLRFRAKQSPSRLESRFLFLWKLREGPPLEREYRFHMERKWRADFAHLPSRTLIEIEGGIWVNGRHNRAAGFNADLEKYLEAGLAGWRVFRLGPDQITMENVGRLVRVISLHQ